MGGSSQLTIRVLIGYPGVFDVVVVLVAPLDALLSPEILKGTGALLCVANLVVEGRAGTISTPVGRPEHWTDSERDSFRGIFLQKPSKPQPTCYPPKDKDSVSKVFDHLPVVKQTMLLLQNFTAEIISDTEQSYFSGLLHCRTESGLSGLISSEYVHIQENNLPIFF